MESRLGIDKNNLGLLHLNGYRGGEDFFKNARREGGSKR